MWRYLNIYFLHLDNVVKNQGENLKENLAK